MNRAWNQQRKVPFKNRRREAIEARYLPYPKFDIGKHLYWCKDSALGYTLAKHFYWSHHYVEREPFVPSPWSLQG